MAGVVTYDLEPPIATHHFLLIGSGNRQQVTVLSGPFLARKKKTNMAGVFTYDTALTRRYIILQHNWEAQGCW